MPQDQKPVKLCEENVPAPTCLTPKLLNIILTTQSFRKYLINKAMLNDSFGLERIDYHEESRRFYNSLPLQEVGLKKNISDFERVCNFKVTDEILDTEYEYLSKFPVKF